jgi:prevent-host-death family protein
MIEMSVKEARSKLSRLLDRVEKGEEIAITRRGEKVALLVSPEKKQKLPKLAAFRSSLKVSGKNLSETVIEDRLDHRY